MSGTEESPKVITDHVWRPTWVRNDKAKAARKECAYMNCCKPPEEHERRISGKYHGGVSA